MPTPAAAGVAVKLAKSKALQKFAGTAVILVLCVLLFIALAPVLIVQLLAGNEDNGPSTSDPITTATPIPNEYRQTLIEAAATCKAFNEPAFLAAYIMAATNWDATYDEVLTKGIAALTLGDWSTYTRVSPPPAQDDEPGLVEGAAGVVDDRLNAVESIYALANKSCANAAILTSEKKNFDKDKIIAWMAYSMYAPMDTVVADTTWPTDLGETPADEISKIQSFYIAYACELDSEKCQASATCEELPVGQQYTEVGVSLYGGYQNGQIPTANLSPIPWKTGLRLHACALTQFVLMNEAYKAHFGQNIFVTDAYRDLAEQYRVKADKGSLAAKPGTSNHGWALATDLGVGGGFSSEQYKWLSTNGPQYGWHNPDWARPNGSKPEPWHFEFFNDATVFPASSSTS